MADLDPDEIAIEIARLIDRNVLLGAEVDRLTRANEHVKSWASTFADFSGANIKDALAATLRAAVENEEVDSDFNVDQVLISKNPFYVEEVVNLREQVKLLRRYNDFLTSKLPHIKTVINQKD